jgi:AcrR family transcriptional regulator
MGRGQDKRAQNTRKAIRSAFSTLVMKKSIDEITVKDIAEEAGISRKTFYVYHDGIWSVLGEAWRDFVGKLGEIVKALPVEGDAGVLTAIIERISQTLDEQYDFYHALLQTKNDSFLLGKAIPILKEEFRSRYVNELGMDETDYDFVMDFTLAGLMRVYQEWVRKEKRGTVEDLSNRINAVVFSGVNGFFKK